MVKIGVVMGSTSDLEVMNGAFTMLDELGIEYEKKVFSAHRTPVHLEQWQLPHATAACRQSLPEPEAQRTCPA